MLSEVRGLQTGARLEELQIAGSDFQGLFRERGECENGSACGYCLEPEVECRGLDR